MTYRDVLRTIFITIVVLVLLGLAVDYLSGPVGWGRLPVATATHR